MKVQLNTKQKALHDRAVHLTQSFSELEFTRIDNLIEIKANGVDKAFGKKMFTYATDILGMDSGLAYSYTSVAKSCLRFKSPCFETA
jgi:hypothetical protein